MSRHDIHINIVTLCKHISLQVMKVHYNFHSNLRMICHYVRAYVLEVDIVSVHTCLQLFGQINERRLLFPKLRTLFKVSKPVKLATKIGVCRCISARISPGALSATLQLPLQSSRLNNA
jgi:hypothetical protein